MEYPGKNVPIDEMYYSSRVYPKEKRARYGFISRKAYAVFERFTDWRIGRISLSRTIPSRYRHRGAMNTQSTDYRILQRVFKAVPLLPSDTFVDIGCGEGRVLSFLLLQGFKGSSVGIELDETVAKTAQSRLGGYDNVSILPGDALSFPKLFKTASAIFLSNPFNANQLENFAVMVEKYSAREVLVYYCHDYNRSVLDVRPRWELLVRDQIILKGHEFPVQGFTVYLYHPEN